MNEIKSYADRKYGKERVNYISKTQKEILESTYGIIIYQEQVMQIANKIAGLSLQDSDLFRRAISKKDASKLSSLHNTFVNGAIKNGYKREIAENIYHCSTPRRPSYLGYASSRQSAAGHRNGDWSWRL